MSNKLIGILLLIFGTGIAGASISAIPTVAQMYYSMLPKPPDFVYEELEMLWEDLYNTEMYIIIVSSVCILIGIVFGAIVIRLGVCTLSIHLKEEEIEND